MNFFQTQVIRPLIGLAALCTIAAVWLRYKGALEWAGSFIWYAAVLALVALIAQSILVMTQGWKAFRSWLNRMFIAALCFTPTAIIVAVAVVDSLPRR